MEKLRLPPDFRDFVRLLNSKQVEHLLVGGYAVGYHRYPGTTGDMDFWIAAAETNASNAADALRQFGFAADRVRAEWFRKPGQIVRMVCRPFVSKSLQVIPITSDSGVSFADCFARRNLRVIDHLEVNIIYPDDRKQNKKASGRTKDLDDQENLP